MAESEEQDVNGTGTDTQVAEKVIKKLELKVQVDKPGACVRHVVVTIPRFEIDRYLKESFNDLAPKAAVPGFRPGRAPRRLVEKHFRERVDDQVKGSLLMDSLGQVTEEQSFSAISEPEFDFGSISIPETGDFTYEFTVEVRPEFPTPNWKGLHLQRPVETIEDSDVDAAISRVLQKYATSQATDEAATTGDRLVLNIRASRNERELGLAEEVRVPLRPVLSFPDGRCANFGDLMIGVVEGEKRVGKIVLTDVADTSLRDQEVDIEFEVVEILHTELPELSNTILKELGDFESEAEFSTFIRESLIRQAEYRQKDSLRQQIVALLLASANWELPVELVRRQTRRELERKKLELRSKGFNDDYIQQIMNTMRRNAQQMTERALREHFVLEQIAEDEKIDAIEADYEQEIELIADQSDLPIRKVRARLEKSGQMDALRNQIIEGKVIDLIADQARLTDTPVVHQSNEEELEFAIGEPLIKGKDVEFIPEAKYDDAAKKEEPLPGSESKEDR